MVLRVIRDRLDARPLTRLELDAQRALDKGQREALVGRRRRGVVVAVVVEGERVLVAQRRRGVVKIINRRRHVGRELQRRGRPGAVPRDDAHVDWTRDAPEGEAHGRRAALGQRLHDGLPRRHLGDDIHGRRPPRRRAPPARANDQGHLAFLIDEPRHGGRWRRDGRVPRFRYQNLARRISQSDRDGAMLAPALADECHGRAF
mmetsp:Transcript_19506/g.60169  ORF Transcript_19506/g.60169 Transcript_19506/m.60169 type:complete len:203 (-) Transcript_19506:920-1528(-)